MKIVVFCELRDRGYGYRFNVTTADGRNIDVGNDRGSRLYSFYSDDVELPKELLVLSCFGMIANIMAASSIFEETKLEIEFKGIEYRPSPLLHDLILEIICNQYTGFTGAMRNLYSDHVKSNMKNVISESDISINYNTDKIIPKIKPRDHATVSFSFGKESNLNRYMFKNVLREFVPDGVSLFFFNTASYNREAYNKLIVRYRQTDDFQIGLTNFNTMRKPLGKILNSTDPVPHITPELLYPFMFLPVAYANKSRYYSMGNEIDTTRPSMSSFNDSLFYGYTIYDESLYFEWIATVAMNELIEDSQFFSPVSPVFETKIVDILTYVDPSAFKDLVGCWAPTRSRFWCCNCSKCKRYYDMLEHLNLPCPDDLQSFPTSAYKWPAAVLKTNELTNQDEYDYYYDYRISYMPEVMQNKIREFYQEHCKRSDKLRYTLVGDYK